MGFNELLLGAFAALAATSLGSFAVIPFKKISGALHSALLAFSAGMMAYSAVEMLSQSHAFSGNAALLSGAFLGLLALYAGEKLLPHIHFHLRKKEMEASKKRTALIVGAVTIHNVPEGLAIASAFAGSTPLGWLVTLAIALQDIPEGFLVSAPLACYGMRLKRCVYYGVLSGLVESAAAIVGFLFLSLFTPLVPFALSFSAGAMAYVIFVELLPEAFRNGKERVAGASFIAGMALAFVLATLLSF